MFSNGNFLIVPVLYLGELEEKNVDWGGSYSFASFVIDARNTVFQKAKHLDVLQKSCKEKPSYEFPC